MDDSYIGKLNKYLVMLRTMMIEELDVKRCLQPRALVGRTRSMF